MINTNETVMTMTTMTMTGDDMLSVISVNCHYVYDEKGTKTGPAVDDHGDDEDDRWKCCWLSILTRQL